MLAWHLVSGYNLRSLLPPSTRFASRERIPPMALQRRQFLKTLAAAATVTVAGTKSTGKVLGANNTIRVGIAGLNGRGGSHVSGLLGKPDVEIVYLIDPDTRTYDSKVRTIQRAQRAPQTV